MSKGSKARPISVDGKEFAENWDRIFNKTAVDDAADVMSKYKKAVSEHETRMEKYRKIWREKGCLHWRKNEDK